MPKYTIDCFTEKSIGSRFPENTYEATTTSDVNAIVHNCCLAKTGIRQIVVWVEEPDQESSPVDTSKNH